MCSAPQMSTYPVSYENDQSTLQLDLVGPDSPQRFLTERFVQTVFARAYGAHVTHFLPTLMTLSGPDGDLQAALGMRRATHTSLFLEVYLDKPVETHIAQITGQAVERTGIVEVGNLASTKRGALRSLITALTAYLSGAGSEWAVFTATPTVLNAFQKIGITLHVLGAAEKARLGAAGELWGSYYETRPVVVAGNVADARDVLKRHLELERAVSLACALWKIAYTAGAGSQRAALTPCLN